MTFDDDHIVLRLSTGRMRVPLKQLGIDWPPPEYFQITGGPFSEPIFKRIRFSQITDEQRAGMTHVCRGAEYRHATAEEIEAL